MRGHFGWDGFSTVDCTVAAALLARGIPFAPQDDQSLELLATSLYSFVYSREELQWLTITALNTFTKWQGIASLRALFSTRFAPRDGLTVDALQNPADAIEREYFESEARATAQKIERWKQERAQLAEREKLQIDGVVEQVLAAPVRSIAAAPPEPAPVKRRPRNSRLMRRAQSDDDARQIADEILREIQRRA